MNTIARPLALVVISILSVGTASVQADSRHYGLRYDMTLRPAEDRADVSLTVDARVKGNIRSMRLHIDPQRHDRFEGDGKIERDGPYVTWTPPEDGGRLSFHVPVSRHRDDGTFAARMTDDWALFRGDDLFPPARTDQHDDAEAEASLHVHLPVGWSFVSAYPKIDDGVYRIEHAHRSFDRPTGWMAAGRLGVRRERIAGVRVAVAGPVGQDVRRLDVLAQLNWNLPEVRRVVPDMPPRLLVVSAGDPMWRGGLSGPNSLYLHADRIRISENGTCTLLHEVMHVVTSIRGVNGADWIAEGIPEYYSLKLMRQSGTITDHRYKAALRKLAEWGKEADRLDVDRSSGAITARAVGILHDLDLEIIRKTGDQKSLDDVLRLLAAKREKVSLNRLRRTVINVMGRPADALSDQRLGINGNDN